MSSEIALNELKESDFQPLINSEFSCSVDNDDSQSFELVEVSLVGSAPEGDQRQAFSLVFRGRNTDSPAQQLYQLEHSQLGQLEIFLVPIGSDQTGMLYEAVFT